MVAAASKSPAVYDLRTFRSRDAVGARVALARKAIREEFEREMQPLGLSAQQAFVIILLGEDRGETAEDMCRMLAHDAVAEPRLIDKLEGAGLVRSMRGSRD